MGKLHIMHKAWVNYLVPHTPSMEKHAYKAALMRQIRLISSFVKIRNTRPA